MVCKNLKCKHVRFILLFCAVNADDSHTTKMFLRCMNMLCYTEGPTVEIVCICAEMSLADENL